MTSGKLRTEAEKGDPHNSQHINNFTDIDIKVAIPPPGTQSPTKIIIIGN